MGRRQVGAPKGGKQRISRGREPGVAVEKQRAGKGQPQQRRDLVAVATPGRRMGQHPIKDTQLLGLLDPIGNHRNRPALQEGARGRGACRRLL